MIWFYVQRERRFVRGILLRLDPSGYRSDLIYEPTTKGEKWGSYEGEESCLLDVL